MRIVSFFKKLGIGLNVLFAASLVLACFVPYISLETVPFVAFLSLGIPILVLGNLLFVLFWGFRGKKQLFLSLIALIIGYVSLSSFFMFRFSSAANNKEADLKVMTYNVRGFNKYAWSKDATLGDQIIDFIKEENPDVLCLQEFSRIRYKQLKQYTYSFVSPNSTVQKSIQAIYSKYPIVNKGVLDFPNSVNNAIFVDIVKNSDTLRVYNLHIESLKVTPDPEVLAQEASSKLYKRLSTSFTKQQQQAYVVAAHKKTTKNKILITGDFNSTQYANVYRTIRGDMQDTFQEKGSGYGRTYNFKYYPVRIDFILVDKSFEVVSHQNYNAKLSDHFPVMTSIKF